MHLRERLSLSQDFKKERSLISSKESKCEEKVFASTPTLTTLNNPCSLVQNLNGFSTLEHRNLQFIGNLCIYIHLSKEIDLLYCRIFNILGSLSLMHKHLYVGTKVEVSHILHNAMLSPNTPTMQ